ncbi:hypothetical protein SFR_2959 [Streptomyces sp. FR-008]|nr:hypothetical protein SFR_2959 [Streptomyces sp. FR-008]
MRAPGRLNPQRAPGSSPSPAGRSRGSASRPGPPSGCEKNPASTAGPCP